MSIGFLSLHVKFEGCRSLKEKRGRLKPLLTRLHREFNVSVAEIDFQDTWQDAMLGCVLISNDSAHTQRSLQQVVRWVETSWPDVSVVDDQIEML
jgi:uncharacterized protein